MNSSPIDAVEAVELTSASDSLTRVADIVFVDKAATAALAVLALPPSAVTVAVTVIDADPVWVTPSTPKSASL